MYRLRWQAGATTEGSIMTEYALAPNSQFTADSPYRTPRVMLEQGLLRAYRVRSNGTMRHVNLYPVGGTLRETAEWISDRIEMDGASVRTVATELHSATATIRRYLEGLELTEEIEAGEWDGLSFDINGDPMWDTSYTESELEADELAGEDSPEARAYREGTVEVDVTPVTRTRRGRSCTVCGKGVTARNSAAKVHGANGYEDMCAACYEYAGWENTHSDNGHGPDNRDADCPVCQADQAGDATIPGGDCEPTGTTADEVADALEASLANAQGARPGDLHLHLDDTTATVTPRYNRSH